MTTGRINQVTILSQRAEAQRQTPQRERVVPSKETPKRPKSPLNQGLQPGEHGRPIQLPPLSSPKAGPQRAMTDVSVATISVTCSPQEEKIHALSHVRRGNSAELSPKIWWIFGIASNPQSPKVPVKINRQDFSSRSKCRCNNQWKSLQYIGGSPPALATWSSQGLDSGRKENFANSYQGIKASNQETIQ